MAESPPGARSDGSRAVFLSYRREASWPLARLIYNDLQRHGFDVFMDTESLDSGLFGAHIMRQIDARTHFIALLLPRSLESCLVETDWMRREIAYAIERGRNIVPVTTNGFDFSREPVLPGDIAGLPSYNAIDIPPGYFDDAMKRLRDRFLSVARRATAGPAQALRFRLVRRLGAGGFSRVWLADDLRLGRRVALKVAHTPDADTEHVMEREARALSAVNHPQCVRIYDILRAEQVPGLAELTGLVLVMEYINGRPLYEVFEARGPLGDLEGAQIWVGVAAALDVVHRQGVLHRDVKPGNILLDAAGAAHIIDFLAAVAAPGFVFGTPDFLPPEVASGEQATPASDAWQLAATISYCFTGAPPRGAHPEATDALRAAAMGAPVHLPRRSALTDLLRASMDNNPRRRPSLREVQEVLRSLLRRGL